MPTAEFTKEELDLLHEALDSHEYWQLTEEDQRNDGHSQVPDGENEEIDACRVLQQKVHDLRHPKEKSCPKES